MTHAPLYYESNDFEYMACPNQEGVRFNNHYYFNSYSQRSQEPDTTREIVLGLGDSVLFGGVMVDQDSIATEIFSRTTDIQMLNISAGSWGPDNCAAYLKHYGLFCAKAMFLVVSSHDAYDNMNFQSVVGVSPNYPDKQYKCGWWELLHRYVLPRVANRLATTASTSDPDQEVLNGIGIQKDGMQFNPGFEELKEISDSASIPLIVFLHADRQELADGKYNKQGEEIISWAEENGVSLLRELDYNFTDKDYRDGIHLNSSGQKKLADVMIDIFSTKTM